MSTFYNITPKYNTVKPTLFYVYIHTKRSNGEVFYVGKGEGKRGWVAGNRTGWWKRVNSKHGCIIEIAQDGMSEDDAHLLEMWLIAKFRHDGVRLCNITDGGEGCSGGKAIRVFSSLGEEFQSMKIACDYLKERGWPKASSGQIRNCIDGRIKSAYGRVWSSDGFPEHPDIIGKEYQYRMTSIKNSREILCSNGMKFMGCSEAARWVSEVRGKRSYHTAISSCAAGITKTAYGLKWWYT